MNLSNDAHWHKKECAEPHCNVSLYLLREAAKHIYLSIPEREKEEAEKIIEEMPD